MFDLMQAPGRSYVLRLDPGDVRLESGDEIAFTWLYFELCMYDNNTVEEAEQDILHALGIATAGRREGELCTALIAQSEHDA